MKEKVLLTALLVVAAVFSVSAQKFKPAPNFLKEQKAINVIFDYSKVVFNGDSQEKYYKKKGNEWIEEWEGKRRKANESNFLEKINDELEKINLTVGNYPDAQYTIIVDILDCIFGSFSAGMLPAKPAKMKCTLTIVKTGTSDILSSITVKESQNSYTTVGTPVDFDRMYLAFGEVGEEIGEKLVKILK